MDGAAQPRSGPRYLAGLEFLGLPPREDAPPPPVPGRGEEAAPECGRARSAELSARELRPLLEEESEHWAGELLWDYRDVSSAVASGLERRALTGFVLQDGPRSVAYCYYMLDAGRAIVGSLFAAAGFRGQGLEEALLDAVLAEAQRHPAQRARGVPDAVLHRARRRQRFARAGFQSRVRHYLVRPLDGPVAVPAARAGSCGRCAARTSPAAAQIIHRSHEGSLDAALNLTYATPSFCRGFVETLVLRAGCGRFDPEASFLAEAPTGRSACCWPATSRGRNGHVCQVSVLAGGAGAAGWARR